MKSSLFSSAEKLRKAEHLGYLRRVMWLSFEVRLRTVYSEIDNHGNDAATLGNLYLTFSKTLLPAYRDSRVFQYNSLNQATISAGWRRLGVWHNLNKGEFLETKPKQAMESGAAISFSQDITGKVMVLLSPYKSDLAKVDEDNFILAFGVEPNNLTEQAIRRLLKTFFRYCAATSMVSYSYSDYIFRLWLRLRDIRNRKIQKDALFQFTEKLLFFVLSAGGIWATLYVGKEWPLF